MPSLRPVALLLLVLLPTACDGLSVESDGPQLPNTCVPTADRPHKSKTAAIKGYDSIVVKAWFNCSVALQDATLTAEIQRREGATWTYVDSNPEDFRPVQRRHKYESIIEISCVEGSYRGRTRMSAHDSAGTLRESSWYASDVVTDPCGG